VSKIRNNEGIEAKRWGFSSPGGGNTELKAGRGRGKKKKRAKNFGKTGEIEKHSRGGEPGSTTANTQGTLEVEAEDR